MGNIRRSVSLYSLQDQYARKRMSLEDMFAFMKELDTGIYELPQIPLPRSGECAGREHTSGHGAKHK